jgi:hypothetical protein
MKKTEQDLLFVELKEPSATRRDVLMSTKDVLDILKHYEEYRMVSQEKQRTLEELKRVVDSLQALNRRLRSKMPKPPISTPSVRELVAREREEKDESISGPRPAMARPKSKLDILQEELEKIESRLGALE